MLLYHGTSIKYLDGILKEGIKPTSNTGVQSYWEVASAEDRVYLSDTYALHYAISAATSSSVEAKEMSEDIEYEAVVLSVEVNENDFIPDEDFLAHATKKPSGVTIRDTKFYRDNLYLNYDAEMINFLGKLSLKEMGTVCVPEVKVNNIIEYTVIPYEDCMRLVMNGCDPSISPMHHKLLGAQYKDELRGLRDRFETCLIQQSNKVTQTTLLNAHNLV